MKGLAQVISDLTYIFYQVPLPCLVHLRQNRHRLVRHTYRAPGGRGCLMNLLTELLPPDQRIDSKAALTRYFGRKGSSPDYSLADDPFYQPAKWIVRLWDGQICEGIRERYGECTHLNKALVMKVLDDVIAERQGIEATPANSGCAHAVGNQVDRPEDNSYHRDATPEAALRVPYSLGGES